MSRQKIDLETLINQYAENKSELDAYKKICDNENSQIKQIMLGAKLPEYSTENYKASCTVSERVAMNEERLLEIAHQYGLKEIVKTKEYIDFDVLEHAIYNNLIPADILMEMDKAKEVKQVVTLRVTKKKEKKGE